MENQIKESTKKMTISEALAAGYEYCGETNGGGWIGLTHISDIGFETDEDEEEEEEWEVYKGPLYFSISENEIKDHVKNIVGGYEEQVGCDTEQFVELIDEVDFSQITEQINNKLKESGYYKPSGIILTKD